MTPTVDGNAFYIELYRKTQGPVCGQQVKTLPWPCVVINYKYYEFFEGIYRFISWGVTKQYISPEGNMMFSYPEENKLYIPENNS